jgi:hypothetical protein
MPVSCLILQQPRSTNTNTTNNNSNNNLFQQAPNSEPVVRSRSKDFHLHSYHLGLAVQDSTLHGLAML